MSQHHFIVPAPFADVLAVLRHVGGLTITETSDLHVMARLVGGGTMVARPAYPDRVDVLVTEDRGDLAAGSLSDLLGRLVGCATSTPAPYLAAGGAAAQVTSRVGAEGIEPPTTSL